MNNKEFNFILKKIKTMKTEKNVKVDSNRQIYSS